VYKDPEFSAFTPVHSDNIAGETIPWNKQIYLPVDPNLTTSALNGNDVTQKHLGKCIVQGENCDDDTEECSGDNDYNRAYQYCNDIGGDVWRPESMPCNNGRFSVDDHSEQFGLLNSELTAIETQYDMKNYWIGKSSPAGEDCGCVREGWSTPYGSEFEHEGCYAVLTFDAAKKTQGCRQWTTEKCSGLPVSVPCQDLKMWCPDTLHTDDGSRDLHEMYLGFLCESEKLKHCGDGIVDNTYETGEECQEECDPGDATKPGCTVDCKRSFCGDGRQDKPNYYGEDEDCDTYDFSLQDFSTPPYTGLTADTATCTSICTLEYCGDGVVTAGEECDNVPECNEFCRRINPTGVLNEWVQVDCVGWGSQCAGPSAASIASALFNELSTPAGGESPNDQVLTVVGEQRVVDGECVHRFRVESKVTENMNESKTKHRAAVAHVELKILKIANEHVSFAGDDIDVVLTQALTDLETYPEHVYAYYTCSPDPVCPDCGLEVDYACGNGMLDSTHKVGTAPDGGDLLEQCDNGDGEVACMHATTWPAHGLGVENPYCANEVEVQTTEEGFNTGNTCEVYISRCHSPRAESVGCSNPAAGCAAKPMCGTGDPSALADCKITNGHKYSDCTEKCQINVCGDGILRQAPNDVYARGLPTHTATAFLITVGYIMGPTPSAPVSGEVEQCDDGNTIDGDGCSALCIKEYCGDGVIQGTEECDDANNDNGDGCSSYCKTEDCGDLVVQTELGEECDGCPEMSHGVATGQVLSISSLHNEPYGCVDCKDQNSYCLVQIRLKTSLTYTIDPCDPKEITANVIRAWGDDNFTGDVGNNIDAWDADFMKDRVTVAKVDGANGNDDLYQIILRGNSKAQTKQMCDEIRSAFSTPQTFTGVKVTHPDDSDTSTLAAIEVVSEQPATFVEYD
jgi:cysteine-rich repeat protein